MWSLPSLLVDWAPYIIVAGALFGLLGLSGVVRPIAAVVEALVPLLKAAVDGFIAAAGWFWRTLVWPADPKQPSLRRGIGDICDDWVTIVTVALMAWVIYSYMDHKVDAAVDQLATCQTEVVKLKKAHKVRPSNDWLWPLW